jgi:hypothetical protein
MRILIRKFVSNCERRPSAASLLRGVVLAVGRAVLLGTGDPVRTKPVDVPTVLVAATRID